MVSIWSAFPSAFRAGRRLSNLSDVDARMVEPTMLTLLVVQKN